MKPYNSLLLVIALLIYGCGIEPKPINYGSDQCSFCKMSIVDKTHSAQVVTTKGRVQSFDAIECLVNFLGENDESEYSYILAADFSEPGSMIDARSAHYLISKQIPSPMGAFLSGFSSEESIDELPEDIVGERLTWQQLKNAH